MGGSCILVLEPGAPGIGVIDRIPLPPKYMIVSGIISSTPTTSILSSPQNRLEINRYGKKTLKAILKEPSVENFLACCWQFAQKTGFATEKIKELVHIAKDNGAVGAAQNMVGEAVHAVVREEKVVKVQEAFKQVLHQQSILVSKLDSQGARLESYT
jgi:pantoate kinase